MGKFVITNRSNEEYQFNLKAANGEIILTSEGYSSKQGAVNGIESVKKHAPVDSNFDRKRSIDRKYYFNLVAGNGEVIGTSEMYETASGRDAGIDSVKSNAPGAEEEDKTV